MKKERKVQAKTMLLRIVQLLIGLFLVAAAFNLFFLKNDIVYGGVSGFAIITKHLFGWNPSLVIFSGSLLLLILSFFLLGKEKTMGSVLGSILFPVFVELTKNIGHYLYIENSDLLLICLFGGIITGIGYGLVFKAGFTTGGTDILSQIFAKYLKVSLGNGLIFSDGLIILAGGFIFGFTKMMYAIIVLYVWSIMLDRVFLGVSSNKCFHIVTRKEKEVEQYILEHLGIGVTILDAEGGYSKEEEKVLLCVVDSKDYIMLKEEILAIDPTAFFIVTDSYEVKGGK